MLRDVLETHRMELEEDGATGEELEQWMQGRASGFQPVSDYGFQQFSEFLNYAQDKTVVRTEPDEERGLIVTSGAEFYPPALPPPPVEQQRAKRRKTSHNPSWKASRLSSSRILRHPSRKRPRRASVFPQEAA